MNESKQSIPEGVSLSPRGEEQASHFTPSDFQLVYSVDAFAHGIAFGQHKLPTDRDPREVYRLGLGVDAELAPLRSRYTLHNEDLSDKLEQHLIRLSRLGVLRDSLVYLGTAQDPFFPFHGKFDFSMKFLELFKRYQPGKLVIQTRSPLLVIALPILQSLGERCSVTVAIETSDQKVADAYTPGLPKIAERLKLTRALRRFGIETSLQVAPLLPYGDWKNDAAAFAELLDDHADYISIAPIHDGSERSERKMKATSHARKLAGDRKFHWLRADAHVPLSEALERRCGEKLQFPKWRVLSPQQIEMFAA